MLKIFKNNLIIFLILCSISFFDLAIFSKNIYNFLELVAIMIIIAVIIIYSIYDNSIKFRKHFTIEILLIFFAAFTSTLGAYYFHNQDFSITLVAQRSIYFFLFYFLLHKIKIDPDTLSKLIIYLGIVYSVIYILQSIVYPAVIVQSKMFIDRNTLRIYMPGAGYLAITYFISISQFFITNKLKYLLLCIFTFVIFILLGSRQVIAAMGLLTLLNIIWSKKLKFKPLVIIVGILCIIPIYYLFKDIFLAMLDMTQIQIGGLKYDNRVKAGMFFLYEFFPNKITYIIGNGVPSANSFYGMKINSYKELLGFYQSDIGLIGDYTKFGLFFAIAQLSIMIRIVLKKMPEKLMYIKYNFIAFFMTLFTGAGPFGAAPNIVIICILLYILDVHLSMPELKIADYNEKNGNFNSNL